MRPAARLACETQDSAPSSPRGCRENPPYVLWEAASMSSRTSTASKWIYSGRPHSALPGAQIVGIPGLQARPLGDGTSIGTEVLLAFKPLRPAGRRVLPRLLPAVDGQVEQPVAVIHRLDAAYRRPVGLEDVGSFSQVANNVHHAHPASN